MKSKYLSIFIICAALLLVNTLPCSANDNTYSYYKSVELIVGQKEALVNSQPVTMEQPAYVNDGRTLIPFRFLGESLGADITWDSQTSQAKLKLADKEVIVAVGSTAAYVNSKLTTLDVPAEITENRLFVPLRFISESLGAVVNYDAADKKITVQCADTSEWEWYTAPISELQYRYPTDWSITTEEDDTTVVFTSPNGSTMRAFLTNESPEENYTLIKKAMEEQGFTLDYESFTAADNVNAGYELQFSIFDPGSNSWISSIWWVSPYHNNMSLIGSSVLDNAYYDIEPVIMSTILYS